jgi:DNA recombination protein RmuC
MFSAAVVVLLVSIVTLNLVLLLRVRAGGESESRLRDELARMQQRQSDENRALRDELNASILRFAGQTDQRAEFLRTNVAQQLDAIRGLVDKRLEQMRQTVDEKLQTTLETRLGESFRLVSERLEQVHKGLGAMQTLASGVGDLKRVLSNVTTRGAWGEVQLENLLGQILSPEQYDRNVSTTGTSERVEFAIKLPGQKEGDTVWLPVDAKFPMESYQRLAVAAERGDAEAVEAGSRELELAVRASAKTFANKYLAPPRTTDFGILFLATEGLYAEALRRPGLAESLQRDYRVVLSGPTTFAALLNSLQMGFRTLTIQQHSSEVWKLLGDVKVQFGKYSGVLSTIRKRLDQAVQTVDDAAVRTRVIERQLRTVESAEDPDDVPQLHLIANGD